MRDSHLYGAHIMWMVPWCLFVSGFKLGVASNLLVQALKFRRGVTSLVLSPAALKISMAPLFSRFQSDGQAYPLGHCLHRFHQPLGFNLGDAISIPKRPIEFGLPLTGMDGFIRGLDAIGIKAQNDYHGLIVALWCYGQRWGLGPLGPGIPDPHLS